MKTVNEKKEKKERQGRWLSGIWKVEREEGGRESEWIKE